MKRGYASSIAGALVAASALSFGALNVAANAPKQGVPVLQLQSAAFDPHHEIPSRYTCEGQDVSPPLAWGDVPPGTQSLALIVDDPDAPDPAAPRRTWVHWVVFNIPETVHTLPEAGPLPAGAQLGSNDFQRTSYGGPCPPVGRHRYFFKLYALDRKLELVHPSKTQLEEAMRGHVLGRAELVGTYEKKKR